jgi:carbamoyltransferase
VLSDETSSWFDCPEESPYMLRAVTASPERAAIIPAVVHRDGTCRIQTVSANDAGLEPFAKLIEAFFQRTGVPLLLNTSLNGPGDPLCNWVGQAKALFGAGSIDMLCIGDEIYESTAGS